MDMSDDQESLQQSMETSDHPITSENYTSEDTEDSFFDGKGNDNLACCCLGSIIFFIVPYDPRHDQLNVLGISSLLYLLTDPLFLFVPLINEDRKCVMVDTRLKIAALVLRSFSDLRYLVRITLRIQDGWRKSLSLMKIAMRIAIPTFSLLPIPQLVVLVFLPNMRGSSSLKIMKFLNSLIVLQYLTRAYPLYKLYMMYDDRDEVVRETPNRSNRFKILLYFYGYLLASHILGAFWFFFSIQREISCWEYAGRTEFGSKFSTSCDQVTSPNVTFINNKCPINPPDESIFDFGIFHYALQSGMQGSTNFPQKFLKCFAWGLRNLSSFASNLVSSSYGWENLFVIVICISGLVLFMYLLGQMQAFMQRADAAYGLREKMRIIEPSIRPLLLDYGIPDKMVSKVKRVVKERLEDDENFIMENIISIISTDLVIVEGAQDLAMEIKCILFMSKLKNVEELKDKDEEVIKKLCQHLRPMIYDKDCYIIREGEPLSMMFFVLQGDVFTFATNKGGSNGCSSTILFAKRSNGMYGEELLTWAKEPSRELSDVPISALTVKSYNKVEVFALKATDLQSILKDTDPLTISIHNVN